MSLPVPNLDDRTFQNLVDDAKRQISLRCPEWTDHNVSDPGVTLIELFAWMTEQMLYRLNQVPEKNYLKFLDLLGVSLEPPAPARTDLKFLLSRPIEDRGGEEAFECVLRARETVAATVRTETEESVEFSTDEDLRLVRPRLSWVYCLEQVPNGDPKERPLVPGKLFAVFGSPPRERDASGDSEGDALYLGFESDISSNVIELEFQAVPGAATGMNPDYPSQVWEYWNAETNRWERLVETDVSLRGFEGPRTFSGPRAEPGDLEEGRPVETVSAIVELAMPPRMVARSLGGRRGCWVRCRYTTADTELPPRGADQLRPSIYQKPPRITQVDARTIGGIAPASNAVMVQMEELGRSDGTPGQVFKLRNAPIIPPADHGLHTILIGPEDAAREDLEEWTEVPDFADSGETDAVCPRCGNHASSARRLGDFADSAEQDRHFVLDRLTGEVFFGPNVLQPDGSARQHGAVPSKGMTVWIDSYRFGGGVRGNVSDNQIQVLKSAIPYIAQVTNTGRATGGKELESLERAKERSRADLRIAQVVNVRRAEDGRDLERLDRARLRARSELRVLTRAVTAEDYEVLAARATSAVGRAKCIQPMPVHEAGDGGTNVPDGVVQVLLVPRLGKDVLLPGPKDLRVSSRVMEDVRSYLDERRLLTAVLEVAEPEYIYISTDIRLVADPQAKEDRVAADVREALARFLHPLQGGPTGDGWPFGRTLSLADLYAQVARVRGVAFLLDAHIFTSSVLNRDTGELSKEEPVRPDADEQIGYRVRLRPNQILCSRNHTVRVRPIGEVGRGGD